MLLTPVPSSWHANLVYLLFVTHQPWHLNIPAAIFCQYSQLYLATESICRLHEYLNVLILHVFIRNVSVLKKVTTQTFHAFFSWFSPGVQYIAFYPSALNGPLSIALPSPVSYIPVFGSELSDHMNLWGRAKNLFYSFLTSVGKCVFV